MQASVQGLNNADEGPKTDEDVVKLLLSQIKVHGHFDEFRKQCSEVIEAQRQFEELAEDVRWFVRDRLSNTVFTPTLTKAKVRGDLRNILLQDHKIGLVLKTLTHRVVSEHCRFSLLPIVENLIFEYLREDQKERVLEWEKRKFEQSETRNAPNLQSTTTQASADVKQVLQSTGAATVNNQRSPSAQADLLSPHWSQPNAVSPGWAHSRSSMMSPNAISPNGGQSQMFCSPLPNPQGGMNMNMLSPDQSISTMLSPTLTQTGAAKDADSPSVSQSARLIKERLREIESALQQSAVKRRDDESARPAQSTKACKTSRSAADGDEDGETPLEQRPLANARRPAIQIHLHTSKSSEQLATNERSAPPAPPVRSDEQLNLAQQPAPSASVDEKQQPASSRNKFVGLAETFRREVERRARLSPRREHVESHRPRASPLRERERHSLHSRSRQESRQEADSRRRADEVLSQTDVRRFYVPRRVVDERATRREDASRDRHYLQSRRPDASRWHHSTQPRHAGTHSHSSHRDVRSDRHARSRSRSRSNGRSRARPTYGHPPHNTESRTRSRSPKSSRRSRERASGEREADAEKRPRADTEDRGVGVDRSSKRKQIEEEIKRLREQVAASKRLALERELQPNDAKRRREDSASADADSRSDANATKQLEEQAPMEKRSASSEEKQPCNASTAGDADRQSAESASESDEEEGSDSESTSSATGSESSSGSESSGSEAEDREDGETSSENDEDASSSDESDSGSSASSSQSSSQSEGEVSDAEPENDPDAGHRHEREREGDDAATKPKPTDREDSPTTSRWTSAHLNRPEFTERYRPRVVHARTDRPDAKSSTQPRFTMRFNERYAPRGLASRSFTSRDLVMSSHGRGVSRSFGHFHSNRRSDHNG